MCAVFIRAIFGSSVADGWPESNWKFWSNPLIVPYAPNTTGTIFVLTFHILLTSISRPLHLLNFSVSFVLTSNHLVWLYRSVDKFIIIIIIIIGQNIQNARQRWQPGNHKGINHFGNLGEAGTIIFKRHKLAKFKWILKEKAHDATRRTGLIPKTHRYTISQEKDTTSTQFPQQTSTQLQINFLSRPALKHVMLLQYIHK